MEIYLVGGAVRDELMGKRPKDFDFSVVLDGPMEVGRPQNAFLAMKFCLQKQQQVEFFDRADAPEHFTARGKFPKNHKYSGLVADFVLARKEGEYIDGRRPSIVEVGTLQDDLARRDFTMNAIAKGMDDNYIDPFNGQDDITNQIIRAVGDPVERLEEDALRALRAIRFMVTKGFDMEMSLAQALQHQSVLDKLVGISDERKMDELSKMFRFDTLASLQALDMFKKLREVVFSGRVSLDATLKLKGRGK